MAQPITANRIGTYIKGWPKRFSAWAGAVGDLLYPPACTLCDAELSAGPHGVQLCNACRELLSETVAGQCPRCAASAGPFSSVTQHCYRCRGKPLHFDCAVRLGVYEGRRREACLKLKHAGSEPLAAAMAAILWQQHGEHLRSFAPDLVLPIPLHWRRRLHRRHNPAETLAVCLARRLHQTCLHRILKRWRATQSQSRLPPSRRYENVRGAFKVRSMCSLEGLRVLLVDDVLTTGATSSEAARVLKRAGAQAVHVAVFCRGEGAA